MQKRILFFLLLISAQFLQGAGYYPFPREEKFCRRAGMERFTPVQNLTGDWTDDSGKAWRLPFWDSETRELNLSYTFQLKPDSSPVYLYFEGIAWVSRIYLNGRLLKIQENPFQDVLIPLENSWLNTQGNVVRVEMQMQGREHAFALKPAVGIHRQVWILKDSTYQPAVKLPLCRRADSVIVYAPYTRKHFYNITQEALQEEFKMLHSIRVKQVYFIAEPSVRVQEAFAEAGFIRLLELKNAKNIVWYNAWPVSPWANIARFIFWKNEHELAGPAMGQWSNFSELGKCERSFNNFYLVLLLMIPLIGLLLFRVFIPQAFFHQLRWLITLRLEMEMVSQRKFMRPAENTLGTLVRLLFTSSALALFLYFLQSRCSGTVSVFHWVEDSWLHNILISDMHPLSIWAVLFCFESGLLLLKVFLMSFMSFFFNIPWLTRTYLDLCLLSAFPLAVFLPGISLYLFYAPEDQNAFWISLWPFLTGIYFFRYILMLSRGLYQQFHFHPLLIFLYICTFEILPWLLII